MVDLPYPGPPLVRSAFRPIEHADEELVVFHDLEELRALVVRRGEVVPLLDSREEHARGVLPV